jgi:hypothetical protein
VQMSMVRPRTRRARGNTMCGICSPQRAGVH